jgi:hypothetical protein
MPGLATRLGLQIGRCEATVHDLTDQAIAHAVNRSQRTFASIGQA